MNKHQVSLNNKELKELRSLVKKGKQSARTINRARILLLANSGKPDKYIREILDVSQWTPQNVRRKYCQGDLKRALYDAPRTGQPRVTTIKEEAEVIAIACTEPEDGYGKWTLDLLTKKVGKQLKHRKKKLSRSTINSILLQSELKPWREKNVVHSKDNR